MRHIASIEKKNGLDGTYHNKYPLLFSVDNPSDLRRLSVNQLNDLADELRNYIIDVVSVKQGHLGSNLGVVELSIALHYVFNTPDEPVIWDVGHQSYAHKILTGRREAFSRLRESGGISGFPSRQESPYDAFGTGHSSTSISAALGMAMANQAKGDTEKNHIAVIGDASIASGMAFEALNHAATTVANLLIVLNDNAIGIDPVSGALEKHLRGLLQGKTIDNVFRALGITYLKVPNGHDIRELITVLQDIKKESGVKLLHIPTVKGKGFPSAEAEQVLYHYPGVFDRATGTVTAKATARYQDIVGQELMALAEKDSSIYVLTPAMPTSSGLAPMRKRMPERVVDTGIAEQHTVTLAAGMTCAGIKPFAVVYSTFLQRAYDQIVHDVALQNLSVRFLIDRSGVVGADGPTHHGVFDIAYLSPIPNMTIIAPSDGAELRSAIRFATGYDKGPIAVRYPRGEAEDLKDQVEEEWIFGKSRCVQRGMDIALLSAGVMLKQAKEAVGLLPSDDRRRIGIYDLRFIKPMDEEMLKEVFSRSRAVVTLEDGVRSSGVGVAVSVWASDNGFFGVPIHILGIPDAFLPCGTRDELYRLAGIDAQNIAKVLSDCLKKDTFVQNSESNARKD